MENFSLPQLVYACENELGAVGEFLPSCAILHVCSWENLEDTKSHSGSITFGVSGEFA